MSPVSPVFHIVETVRLSLNSKGTNTFSLEIKMSMVFVETARTSKIKLTRGSHVLGHILNQSLIGSRWGLNPGPFNLKSPTLPSELPCLGIRWPFLFFDIL